MGNACKSDSNVNGGGLGDQNMGKSRIGQDPSLVLPDFQEMRMLINKKTNQLDLDITRSSRGSSSSDQSLILPACKSISPSLITRYFLVYSFYIAKYADKNGKKLEYQKLFYDLLEKSTNEASQKQLVANLKTEIQKQSNEYKQSILLIKNSFKVKVILEALNKVLLLSKDPKDLSYFIFPIHSLHNGIKANYLKASYKARKDPIWIVAVLESKEIDLIKKMDGQDNYFFFSAFIRGFTVEKWARQQFKAINKANKNKTFIFNVNFPTDYSKINKDENNGFYILQNADQQTKKKGDVLFNIMSSFRLVEKTANNEYDLLYGELAYLYYKKVNRQLNDIKDPMPLKIYQVCKGVSKYYLKSQSCLFRIVGNQKESLGVSRTVMSSVAKTQSTGIINDIERQNLVNTHIEKGQYDQALKITQERDTLLFKAKKIQVLFQKNKHDEAKEEIKKISQKEKDGKNNLEARILIDLITARIEMKNSEFQKAQKRLKNIYNSIYTIDYDNCEYLGRDVIAALIECEKKGLGDGGLKDTQKEGADLYNSIAGTVLRVSSLTIKHK